MNPQFKMRLANKGKGEFRAEDNTLWLYDAIASDEEEAFWMGGVSPRDFIAALARTTGPVTLRINSPGGSVFGAQAMVAAMRNHAQPITARIDSLAASAASVIAAECAECEMVPGSMLMIHKAWGLAIGNADDMLATAELLEKIDGQIAATYARRAGDDKDWSALMAAETWFTAEEALAAGLVSRVAEENKQRPANRWDLSAFARAPVADVEPTPEPVNDDAPLIDMRASRARQLAARLASSPI
jgi:ATP-dependent Clp protease, protease subunit